MELYTTRDVARIFDLPAAKVRRLARSTCPDLPRGDRNQYLYRFQDLVLIRTALELEAAKVPARRVREALRGLRSQLPDDRPLTAVRVAAEGERVVVHDGRTMWHPDSGQVHFDFSLADVADQVAAIDRQDEAVTELRRGQERRSAAEWCELAVDHEHRSPFLAKELYRRALEVEPDHADSLVNLGRLNHEEGDLEGARTLYLEALEGSPHHATAAFNLGVVLEDMCLYDVALEAYMMALAVDPELADAHYNLWRLCEATGDRAGALRHLRSYRDLVGRSGSPS